MVKYDEFLEPKMLHFFYTSSGLICLNAKAAVAPQ